MSDDLFALDERRVEEPAIAPVMLAALDPDIGFLPRKAAAFIVALPTKEQRNAALADVPVGFQGMVSTMVERAFYNKKKLNEKTQIPGTRSSPG